MVIINTKHVFIASAALYIYSLTQDCFYLDFKNPKELAPGYLLLLVGWMGIFYGYYAWIANPLLFLAWLLMAKKQYMPSLVLSLISLLFVISFLFYEKILVRGMPENIYVKIISYGFGYWAWLLSIVTLVVGVFLLIKKKI